MRTKKHRRRRWWLGLLIALALLVTGGFWLRWQCWGVTATHARVMLSALPKGFDGLRVAHLSDLHGHEYGEGSADLIAMVRAEEPELIFITGDLIDRAEQLPMVPALARGLSAIAPTYYVTGNHEWGCGSALVKELKGVLKQCGVTVLSNQFEVVERGGDTITLAGVDDPNGYADQTTPEELAAEIGVDQPGRFTLLLAHRNDAFERYAAAGYDMIFSGHGHGGIVRLPFTDGLLSPARTFFPTWTAGEYRLGDSTQFVSRGLGNNTSPIRGFRIFNRPELAIVELRAEP